MKNRTVSPGKAIPHASTAIGSIPTPFSYSATLRVHTLLMIFLVSDSFNEFDYLIIRETVPFTTRSSSVTVLLDVMFYTKGILFSYACENGIFFLFQLFAKSVNCHLKQSICFYNIWKTLISLVKCHIFARYTHLFYTSVFVQCLHAIK